DAERQPKWFRGPVSCVRFPLGLLSATRYAATAPPGKRGGGARPSFPTPTSACHFHPPWPGISRLAWRGRPGIGRDGEGRQAFLTGRSQLRPPRLRSLSRHGPCVEHIRPPTPKAKGGST